MENIKSPIREIKDFEDFRRVYGVFSGPPYNEFFTKEENEKLFKEYQENGYIYGAYAGDICIGMIVLEKGVKPGQPVEFPTEKVMYLAELAVGEEYRRCGLGSQLIMYGVMQAKAMGYEKMYMRTLVEGSMSRKIAEKIGFKEIPGAFQRVRRACTIGPAIIDNMFLEIDLNSLSKEKLKQGVRSAGPMIIDEEELRR